MVAWLVFPSLDREQSSWLRFLSSRELCKSEIDLACVRSQEFTQQHLVESLPEHQAHIIYLDGNPETFDRFTQENSETGVTPDNLAYVIYISGSTGQPNPVAWAHSGAVNTLLDINHRFEVAAGDRPDPDRWPLLFRNLRFWTLNPP